MPPSMLGAWIYKRVAYALCGFHHFIAALISCPLFPQVALLQQIPQARITVVDFAALPLRHQVALAHRTHVMVSHLSRSIRHFVVDSAVIRSVCTARG